ncbi:MAG: CotH kinase family protein [Bacteroidales bacterium]|nr:CotH kinase family protein [Bacteroidales bacterium]
MKSRVWIALMLYFVSVAHAQDNLITYSQESGFYTAPFELTLTSSGSSTEIAYTLDGSDPKNTGTGFADSSPVTIQIDPDNTTGRALTPGVVVRAIAKNGSLYVGASQCKTYIFTDKLGTQASPGGDWPAEDYHSVNNHNIDYSMDPDVVEDPLYSGQIESSLLSLPAISIVTDVNNLFHPDSGIYVNSFQEGELWERECSFAIINPDNTQEFQINAGIRIKGGWSRQVFNPKYSLRILFKENYGPEKLEYAFFETDGALEFKHIELRTEQNCGYNLDGGIAFRNTFLRDVFARDAQRDMDHAYIRSRYYHLYVNGMYWGLYMTHERVNEDYAKSYFGGDKDNYDVIKATDLINGSMDAWYDLWTLSDIGFESNADYFGMLGRNAEGDPVRGSEIYCDADNLIDYMNLVFYTGNFDGPVSLWGNNQSAANFFALTDRTDKSFGFKFFAVDFEYAMMVDPIYVGAGLYEDRVNIGDPDANPRMSTPSFGQFNPQWLHYKLTQNPEYRMNFIDRAYYLFEENGELTPERSAERMTERIQEVEEAIVAESARWGDAQQGEDPPLTKADWDIEVNTLLDGFFPYRTDIVIQQLKEAGLYSDLTPPGITISGTTPINEYYFLAGEEEVAIANPNGTGTLYYTTNGRDPRAIGGEVSPDAITVEASSESFTAGHSITIKARVKNHEDWSPIRAMKILAPVISEDYTYLKVTELNYNPLDEVTENGIVSGSDFEFIEFKNTGPYALNISGIHLDSAVQYTVPAYTILNPDEYFVVADKPKYFYHRYGWVSSGNFSGNFSNSGEYVLLEDSMHNEILSFTYSDSDPWPELADGLGYTMVSVEIDPTGDPALPEYWTNSPGIYGNPFSDTATIILEIHEEITGNFKVYPNPTSDYLIIKSEDQGTSQSQLIIYSIMGRLIYRENFYGETEINFARMSVQPGIYIVVIQNGRTVKTEKIIYQ